MQEKLIIYLANDSALSRWIVIDSEKTIKQQGENVEQLAQVAHNKEIIVLVPTIDVLLTTVKLPKMHRSRLLQALPYALEEQLIAEVDTLHFAIADQIGDELSVAIVAKEKLQQWLALLRSWNIEADACFPIVSALPVTENSWHIMVNPTDDMILVRIDQTTGFVAEKKNLAELLAIALSGQTVLPTLIHLHNYSEEAIAPLLNVSATMKEDFIQPTQFMRDLALQVDKQQAINLLQGTYAVKKAKFTQAAKMWKYSVYLACIWAALLFIYPLISYFILKHRVDNIDAQMATIYQQQFPQATSMVMPKIRMQEKLQKLTTRAGENRLLLLLGYVGKGLLAEPNIKFKRLDFQNEQLSLELTALTSDDFAAFTDFLSQHGLSVKQQNANLDGARVNATLLVE